VHAAAAFRTQIADRHRDGWIAVQRLAEPVGAERLDVIFEIGRRDGGSLLAKMPSWLGAIDSGPLRFTAYSSPMRRG
jgi:hypothetical protein